MTLTKTFIVTILISLIIFSERLFPFAIFAKKAPGKLIHIFERYVPPVIMLGLLIYNLRGIRFSSLELWVPSIVAILFTIVTYLLKKNTLISIFGGTILYMILMRVM